MSMIELVYSLTSRKPITVRGTLLGCTRMAHAVGRPVSPVGVVNKIEVEDGSGRSFIVTLWTDTYGVVKVYLRTN